MILKDIRAFFFYLFFILAAIPFLFGVSSPKDSQRIAFVNNALSYLGTPYRYAGHSRKGMDCSGFVFRNGADVLKLQMPRRSDTLAEYAKRITDEEIQPGDLLFFNTAGGISHVGIYIGAGKFIHSASDGPHTGVIISSIQESYWRKTYRFAGSIMKPEEIFFAEATIPFFSRTLENCRLHPDIWAKVSDSL
ncbi:C40 family peptidase [Treponema sp. OMZ 857]|uniref:C40 family peptidase n=1 Tax=Treponema sp. OMZ 857 TaxID=1643513 RepID=UPI0020A51AFC|nr:C40 family peptidase [Treponema sp. OMZ 857]UTC43703.1 C40 family peptidase [Treponema sp. OMZ 857]